MSFTAVITGDMVASKSFSSEERDQFIFLISNLGNFLDNDNFTSAEIFRGDSFQLKISNPLNALKSAVIIRAICRSQSFRNTQWDCRLSIGIGKTEFEKDSPRLSDGEAYRLSGYSLDKMRKKRLIITTPWHDINEELSVSTAFADDIISGWTIKQSKVMISKLQHHSSNAEIAQNHRISRQAVDKLVNSAKFELIELYLNHFHKILSHKL